MLHTTSVIVQQHDLFHYKITWMKIFCYKMTTVILISCIIKCWNRLMIKILKIHTFLNTYYCMYIKFLLKKNNNKNHKMCLFVADFYTNACWMSFGDFSMRVMNFQNVQENHGRREGIQSFQTVVSIKLCLTCCCKWIVLWI